MWREEEKRRANGRQKIVRRPKSRHVAAGEIGSIEKKRRRLRTRRSSVVAYEFSVTVIRPDSNKRCQKNSKQGHHRQRVLRRATVVAASGPMRAGNLNRREASISIEIIAPPREIVGGRKAPAVNLDTRDTAEVLRGPVRRGRCASVTTSTPIRATKWFARRASTRVERQGKPNFRVFRRRRLC